MKHASFIRPDLRDYLAAHPALSKEQLRLDAKIIDEAIGRDDDIAFIEAVQHWPEDDPD